MEILFMKKRCLYASVILALSSSAFAGSYQGEAAGSLAVVDQSGGDNATVIGGRGNFYFAPVNNAGKPLAEAAFLSKASGVKGHIDLENSDSNDTTRLGLGAEVYIPRSIVYLGIDLERVDTDYDDNNAWIFTGGITPIDGLLVTTSYNEDTGYDLNVHAKYVTKLGGQQSVKFFGGLVDDDSNTINAGFHFYFNRQLGAGMEIIDSGDNTDFKLQGDYFLNENTFVRAFYRNSDYADTLGVEVGARF